MANIRKIFNVMLTGAALATLPACATNSPDMRTAKLASEREDYTTAMQHYAALADWGMPRAEMEVGKMYLWGKGVEKDPRMAREHFLKARDMGEDPTYVRLYLARAQSAIDADTLGSKTASAAERKAAFERLRAEAATNQKAAFEIGYAYEKGLLGAPNGPEAARYYAMSGDQGYSRGFFYEGRLYRKGELVAQDLPRAISLFEDAGAEGYSRAYTELAEIYTSGEGIIAADPAKAAYYRSLAAQ